MPESSVVYVIQRPKPRKGDSWVPDLSKATQYGRLEFIFSAEDVIFREPEKAIAKLTQKLDLNFRPEKDYLLWCNFGDPAASWLVPFFLGRYGIRSLRYLYWDQAGFYHPVEFNLP